MCCPWLLFWYKDTFKTTWPAKLKIFTAHPFIEKFSGPWLRFLFWLFYGEKKSLLPVGMGSNSRSLCLFPPGLGEAGETSNLQNIYELDTWPQCKLFNPHTLLLMNYRDRTSEAHSGSLWAWEKLALGSHVGSATQCVALGQLAPLSLCFSWIGECYITILMSGCRENFAGRIK